MWLFLILFALGGVYNGPIKKVLSPLPDAFNSKILLNQEIIKVPRLPLPVEEGEPRRGFSPGWRYVEDEAGADTYKSSPGGRTKAIETKFSGIGFTYWIPPDVQIAAGPDYVGEIVNSTITFYTKSGVPVYSSTLKVFFSSLSPSNNFIFDPKIAYDVIDGHWIVLALQLNDSLYESNYYLAVSVNQDPLGSWHYYSLDATLDGSTPTNNWADYPGLGFNDWGIFITSNQYGWSGGWNEAKLRVLDKSAAYNGTLSGWYDFTLTSYCSSWKPAQSLSSTQTEFILRSYWNGSDLLRAWKVTGTPSSPTLSPRYDVSVQFYDLPPGATQMGTDTTLDSGDARIQDVTYKDGFIFATLTEKNPLAASYCAARYFKLDTTFVVQEDISYGSDGFNYIYPRVAVSDSCVAMVFTRCGQTEYAGVRYTKKEPSASLFEPSTLIKEGEGPYVLLDGSDRNRWGDYSGAYMDPDRMTIWLCGEYAESGNMWGTWIAQVSVSPFTSLGSGSFWFSSSPSDTTPIYGIGNVQVGDTLTLHAWLYADSPYWENIGLFTFPLIFDTFYLDFLVAAYDTGSLGPPSPYGTVGLYCPSGCEDGALYPNMILFFGDSCTSGCFSADSTPYYLGYLKFVVKNPPGRDTGIVVIDTVVYPPDEHAQIGNEVGTEYVPIEWTPFRIASGTGVTEKRTINRTRLLEVEPNPFMKTTNINFSLHKRGDAQLTVFDRSGRYVCDILSEELKSGQYTVRWDGKDSHGKVLPSGTYFLLMKIGDYRAVIRLLKIR